MMKRGYEVESAPSIWKRQTAMEHYYAKIDVSLELSSVCVVDAQGKIVKEAKVIAQGYYQSKGLACEATSAGLSGVSRPC
jgi:hypothetical protein